MAFHFCPQCGTKLQPNFRFCPSCGEKLPGPETPAPISSTLSPSRSRDSLTSTVNTSPKSSTICEPTESLARASVGSSVVAARPPLRKTRNSLRLDNLSIKDSALPASSPAKISLDNTTEATATRAHTITFKADTQEKPLDFSLLSKSPRTVGGKAKRKAEDIITDTDVLSVPLSSPVFSPNSKSPSKGKSKSKKTKLVPALEPLKEETEVTDTAGKKWKLIKLLNQATTEILYEVSPPSAKEAKHILKLGAKDGKIFNEQNFLQRAVKSASVEKWIKQNKLDFMGLPQCVGFGLHADSYRFLIFPNMGQSLQSLMQEQNRLLSEMTVLQLSCRLLDILQYIHSNEYVHADINAENIYINQGWGSQVYLVGYYHAFRYCPGGQHVEYREGSRTPHEGALEFISVDTHSGAGPSRRSDLQSLGYCMLYWHTGKLPWSMSGEPEQIAAEKKKYTRDVPSLLSQCYGKKKVSSAFESFLSAVNVLEYTEQPDYTALKSGLSTALKQLGGSVEQKLSI